jgi:nucleotide-binding universal stress UspA family protein
MDAAKAEENTLDDTLKDMLITSSTTLLYKTILVPHDGSKMADIALKHAIYLSNLSGAEIIILNILEHVDSVDSRAVLVTSKEGNETRDNYEIRLEGEVKSMVEEKIR